MVYTWFSGSDSTDTHISTLRLDAFWKLGPRGEYARLCWGNGMKFLVDSDRESRNDPKRRGHYWFRRLAESGVLNLSG